MMWFVAKIKEEIHQLDNAELKGWLLSHLNDDAVHLTELFCKQNTNNCDDYALSSSLTHAKHSFILSLIFIYGTQELKQNLTEKLSFSPSLISGDEPAYDQQFQEQLEDQLNVYQLAWPLIETLRAHDPNELISLLEEADHSALTALARVTHGSELQLLIDAFLATNTRTLESINRNKLIQFLRQPDFSEKLRRYLLSLVSQADTLFSLKVWSFFISGKNAKHERLQELNTFIAAYPFSLDKHILWAICHSMSNELRLQHFDINHCFTHFIHTVLQRMTTSEQGTFLKGLDSTDLVHLIDHALRTSPEDSEYSRIFTLLSFLCSASLLPDPTYLEQVRNRLQHMDVSLFNNSDLEVLAQEILASPTATQTLPATENWIHSLLHSPRFIAASTPLVIQQLSDRYRLLGLTQASLHQFVAASFKEMPFYLKEVEEQMRYLQQKELTAVESGDLIQKKRTQLVKLRIERCLQAIYFQLEQGCELEQDQNKKGIAQRALSVLYHYYALFYPSIRTDLLSHWLNTANSSSTMRRKQGVFLFNSLGQAIGFLNERNEAMTFVNQELVLLISTDSMAVNDPVYDAEGCIIGLLTPSGLLQSTDVTQKTASVQILAAHAIKDLELSPVTTKLLVHTVLFDDSVAELFDEKQVMADAAKREWLLQRLATTVADSSIPIEPNVLHSLLGYWNEEQIFILLGTIKHSGNALEFFRAILLQDKTRDLFFSGVYEADFHQFLVRHEPVRCFAYYLQHGPDCAGFSEGLSRFAFYAKKHKIHHLLSQALSLLASNKAQNSDAERHYDATLNLLISTEGCATVVLKEFLDDRQQLSIQQITHPEIKEVMRHFHKEQVLILLRKMNITSFWEGTAQYKILLHLLEQQKSTLFPIEQNNLAPQAWQKKELHELAHFINRHLNKKRALDEHFALGYAILGELVFRSANLGQTSVFYFKKKFNSAIARLSFTRAFLESLVNKFWIPAAIKEQIAEEALRIRSWFNDQTLELQSDTALHDWRHLVQRTWKEINKKKLPIICAYLLNYSGKKNPLLRLLTDYFNVFQSTLEYLHPVTNLLHQFPGRDVSGVIFDALESAVSNNPLLLDRIILRDMGHYFTKTISQQALDSPYAEVNLLLYFGQNKHYELVQRGCEILGKNCTDQELKKRLIRAGVEAELERSLGKSIGYFYFDFIKALKRLWYYGFNAETTCSNLVKFCDDDAPGPQRPDSAQEITIPRSAKQASTYAGFATKRKQLLRLLDTIKRTTTNKSINLHSSQAKHSLFAKKENGAGATPEKIVASQQEVITI